MGAALELSTGINIPQPHKLSEGAFLKSGSQYLATSFWNNPLKNWERKARLGKYASLLYQFAPIALKLIVGEPEVSDPQLCLLK